jgi:hypothetical protein
VKHGLGQVDPRARSGWLLLCRLLLAELRPSPFLGCRDPPPGCGAHFPAWLRRGLALRRGVNPCTASAEPLAAFGYVSLDPLPLGLQSGQGGFEDVGI